MICGMRGQQRRGRNRSIKQLLSREHSAPIWLNCRLKYTMKKRPLYYEGVVFRIIHSITDAPLGFDEYHFMISGNADHKPNVIGEKNL